ncbi:MAG: TetR/AcrR family transcriptional regulator [Saprospiraceae bacterium]
MTTAISKARVSKELIFREAAILFQRKGYQATSMRELATQVGLEVSSLYSHIRSKQEILERICFDNAEQFIKGLEQIELGICNPASQMQDILGLHIDRASIDPSSITVFNDEWRQLDEPALTRFIQLRKNYESRLLFILESGIEQGVFKRLDPQILLLTILSIMRGVHHWVKSTKSDKAEEIKKVISAIMLDGLLFGK